MAGNAPDRYRRAITPEAAPDRLRVLNACLHAQCPFQRAGDPIHVVWKETDAGMEMEVDGVYHTTLTWEELDVPVPPWEDGGVR